MSDIARGCGCEPGNLYNYFSSKEQILYEVIKFDIQRMFPLVKRIAADKRRSSMGKLKYLTRAHFRLYGDFGRMRVLVISTELRYLSPSHRKTVEGMIIEFRQIVEGIIKEGIETGEFRKVDVKVATSAFLSMLVGSRLWFDPKGRLSADKVADVISNIVCNGLIDNGRGLKNT